MVVFPLTVVQILYALNLNIVASSAFFFWDNLLTLDKEVRYIWGAGFSWISILFGIIRFLSVGGQVAFLVLNVGTLQGTESLCRGFLWFRNMLGIAMFILADGLLILRLFAFYRRNKFLLIFLCTMELVGIGAVLGLASVAIPKYELTANPNPRELRVGTCITLGYPNFEPDLWIPLLAIQAILFGLSVGRHVYLQRDNLLLPITQVTSDICQIFIRDDVWVFFVLFFDLLLCAIGNALHIDLGLIAIQWCYPIIGVSVSRLILNLRHSAYKQSHRSRPAISITNGVVFGEKESQSSSDINP